MAGEQLWLTVGEAVERMKPVRISEQTIRRLADSTDPSRRLRAMRSPGTRRDRLILAADVDRLKASMLAEAYGDNPPNPEEDAQARIASSADLSPEGKSALLGELERRKQPPASA